MPAAGGSEPVDVTELDLPFTWGGGGVVSTAGEIARMLQALLGGELLPEHLREEMLRAVDSDWNETDRYGLGVGEITAVMGRQQSPCGAAWGHISFSAGYTAIALSSEDGERQVVSISCRRAKQVASPHERKGGRIHCLLIPLVELDQHRLKRPH